MRLQAVLRIIAVGIAVACAGAFSAAEERRKAEIVPQLGHSKDVTSVAFSPDAKTLLSASSDKTLRLWDLATGREIRKFEGHSKEVTSVAFSPDGKTALSGSEDDTLRLWDLRSGREISKFEGHSSVVSSVAFAPDGKTALSGSWDNTLRLWDLATGREIRKFEGHSEEVTSVAFSPDGKTALSGSWDKTLRLWELSTGGETRKFQHHGGIRSVAFSPDGKAALSGGDGKPRFWDLATGREIRKLADDFSSVAVPVVFSPDGRTALSGELDNTLRLWDLATGRVIRQFGGHSEPVESVIFLPEGKAALSGSEDGMLRLWDLTTGREVRKFEVHQGRGASLAISPDGKTALWGNWPLKLWNVSTGREIRQFEGHSDLVSSVAFAPDGKTALSGSYDKTLRLWELSTGREIRKLKGHERSVTSVAISPDGKTALSGSDYDTLRLWDLAKGREVRKFAGDSMQVTSVAFSPDGKTALSGSVEFGRGELKLWDVATGSELRKFRGMFQGHQGGIRSVAFSPDGKAALSGGDDHTLRLWDMATGLEMRKFEGHEGGVRSIAFSPDGKAAVSGGEDGTVRFWDLQRVEALVSLLASREGDQIAITPKGFFTSSQRDTDRLAIVRGLEVTSIGQVYQSLFNPDLVREALAGDPSGEVREAAKVVNLEAVLDSGPAPEVAILSPAGGTKPAKDLVTVRARIADKGKGVGRIEWRVNGITAAVLPGPSGSGPVYTLSRELALDPGANTIEVIAYNGCVKQGCNLLASLPARTTVEYTAPAGKVQGKLHVLAIGIDDYVDPGYAPPGFGRQTFGKLTLAVADAKAFAAEIQKAGAGMYSEVRIWPAHDANATAAGLNAIVKKLSAEIQPRDTFVLFAAAHGYSDERGRFYLIPQDYQGGPGSFAKKAISQEQLQEWMANIKARKAIILLDTCNSGDAVNGYARSRSEAGASEAAVGRLHEATGRPVLTASNSGATETDKVGHGLFTHALIEALHHGEVDKDGYIQVSALARYVEDLVPKLAAELNGDKRAAIVIRGFASGQQAAHFGTTGGDFPLVRRLQ